MRFIFFTIGMLFLTTGTLFAQSGSAENEQPAVPLVRPAESTKSNYLLCKNQSVVRTLRIEKRKSQCVTTYSKDGVETVVGKSGTQELCHQVFDKIRETLEKANWKCKDITQSRVSFSAE